MKQSFFISKIAAFFIIILFISAGCHPTKKITKIDTDPIVDELIKKGNKKLVLKDYKGAIADFTKIIEQSPDCADAYLFRAIAYYNLKDLETAMKDIDKSLELQPLYAEAFDVRGCIKGDKGDKTGACEDWNKSFDLGFNPAAELIEKYCQQ